MIFRFLNASTIDGNNPYRITKDGFEWEIPEPGEPWANIGYWGDHQIIYLLKLLELSNRFYPDRLPALLDEPLFVCANVPYRLAGFEETWNNPQETITFDHAAQKLINERVNQNGEAGKLLTDSSGEIFRMTLLEKLLIPLLNKLSNFIPEGGIWMNTQRPEWNDANNALVGNGLSVVTLGYLHRYLGFMENLIESMDESEPCRLQKPLLQFVTNVSEILSEHAKDLGTSVSPQLRYCIVEKLGKAGADYRHATQEHLLIGDRENVTKDELACFLREAKAAIQHSLRTNRRQDGLFHSYNLMRRGEKEIRINHLYEMLEGQVSILSAQLLSTQEAVELLDALRRSSIYRQDRRSYMLYPDRNLPTFLEKNIIDETLVSESKVLTHLLENKDTRIAYRDAKGLARFNGSFRNASDLVREIDLQKQNSLSAFSENDFQFVTKIFEDTFQHHSFTGRSGTFFAYEGLGSIYWHMVSKLLLAIQESYLKAAQSEENQSLIKRLATHYYETLEGLGIYQEPSEYGAFPSDAYSHTPKHSGAQQPGMTGQVKEDILIRWGELGIDIIGGQLTFRPRLLRFFEFLKANRLFHHQSIDGRTLELNLAPEEMAFTFCQVPIIYTVGTRPALRVTFSDHREQNLNTNELPKDLSEAIFSRDGTIRTIRFTLPKEWLQ